jgi:hypothetical protein
MILKTTKHAQRFFRGRHLGRDSAGGSVASSGHDRFVMSGYSLPGESEL